MHLPLVARVRFSIRWFTAQPGIPNLSSSCAAAGIWAGQVSVAPDPSQSNSLAHSGESLVYLDEARERIRCSSCLCPFHFIQKTLPLIGSCFHGIVKVCRLWVRGKKEAQYDKEICSTAPRFEVKK